MNRKIRYTTLIVLQFSRGGGKMRGEGKVASPEDCYI
jgi:hypothetical protein